MDKTAEQILRRRAHGLYVSRRCGDIAQLSHELLGMHCWFYRNVAFSALIRGADIAGWNTALTKTWVHHALHAVVPEDLPALLALNPGAWRWGAQYEKLAEDVLRLMEDGVYSRAEMRLILADAYDGETLEKGLSPWGGVFCELARLGKVAFRDLKSRDFELIDAEPTRTFDEVLPAMLRRYLTAYGPATLADAAWFFGLQKERKKALFSLDLEEYARFEYQKSTYYYVDDPADMGEIPELTLLSGFDPFVVSYAERSAVLPPAYRSAVVMKSGICLPTVAINGRVAGLWNIKKGEPVLEFFDEPPGRVRDAAYDLVCEIQRQTAGIL